MSACSRWSTSRAATPASAAPASGRPSDPDIAQPILPIGGAPYAPIDASVGPERSKGQQPREGS